jgi:hypothetical protein
VQYDRYASSVFMAEEYLENKHKRVGKGVKVSVPDSLKTFLSQYSRRQLMVLV